MTKATEIDVMVGARVRVRRLELDLTQQELGRKLGITFQQIQKYESGHNRISAGRLKEISRVLQVPIAYFFADADEQEGTGGRPVTAMKLTAVPGATDLLMAYARLDSPAMRKSVVTMVRSLARTQSLDAAPNAPGLRGGARASRRPRG
jgi:transcriptional regulator with XRE-family HTH domain